MSVKPSFKLFAFSISAIFWIKIYFVGGEGHGFTLISENLGQKSSPFIILTRFDSLIIEEENFDTKNSFIMYVKDIVSHLNQALELVNSELFHDLI